jgi:hypothetical protein
MCKAPPTAAATVIRVKEGAKPLRETKGHNPNHTFCSVTLKTFLPYQQLKPTVSKPLALSLRRKRHVEKRGRHVENAAAANDETAQVSA